MSLRTKRQISLGLTIASGLMVAAYGLRGVLDLGGEAGANYFNRYVYDWAMGLAAVACVLRATVRSPDRAVWIAIAAASVAATAGNVTSTFLVMYVYEDVPVPSIADVFWEASAPLVILAIILMGRRGRQERPSTARWADAVLSGMAVATLSTSLVLERAIDLAGGTGLAEFVVNISYPAADLTMVAVGVAVLALRGWRLNRPLALLIVGALCQAVSDSLYASGAADGTWFDGGVADLGWLLAGVAFAAAAWSPPVRRDVGLPRAELIIPMAFGVVGSTVLAIAAFGSITATTATVTLGVATLIATLGRMAVSLSENHRLLATSRREATTDAVTSLGNRRKLLADLRAIEGQRVALTVFDLNGFKAYNDTYGHAAGDALLERIGHALRAAVEPHGTAYRMGGDEFSALIATTGAPDGTALAEAMAQRGDGFAVTAAHGTAIVPDDAASSEEALRIADTRMYAQKHGSRATPDRQVTEALLAALEERSPGLATHSKRVADLVDRTARRCGLTPAERAVVRTAALLHDVGMLAVPESIMQSPGVLSDEEWGFIRRHTLVGERVLGAAPDLQAAGAIVRSGHERWDGTGYPDGLAGADIPFGARLLFACDAFDAMGRARPYAAARERADAIRELRRYAGTQFDADVVEALAAVLADEVATAPAADATRSAARS